MIDPEDFKNIRALALSAVEDPDFEAFFRQVCRWFSEKFSTPLKEVEGYSEEYVLQHYFEDLLYNLKRSNNQDAKDHYEHLLAEITHTKEDEVVEEQIEAEDDEWERQMLEEIRKDEEKRQAAGGDPEPIQPIVNPNLIEDHQDVHMSGEDDIPFDDESE